MKNTDINTEQIEQAILSCAKKFTIHDVTKALSNNSQALRDRIFRLLDCDDRFFSAADQYIWREDFFTGYTFAVTPDDWEIANRILVPGHRFSPYFPADIFPSEIQITFQGKPLPRREITAPLGHLFHYHLLLGSESIFEHLAAENPANSRILQQADAGAAVTLTIYDLSGILPEDAANGDSLIFKVEDYYLGALSVEFASASGRSGQKRKAWIEAADDAVESVIDRFGEYPDLPEQLACAVFTGGEKLSSPDASWDEYIRSTVRTRISADGDHAVLVKNENLPAEDFCADEVNDLLSISDTPLDDTAGLLSSLNSSLSTVEIDSFILDACYARELDFSDLFRRLFGQEIYEHGNDVKKAALLNYLEERSEYLQENYNRADDESKAELRAMILDGVQERLDYLRSLAETDRDPEEFADNIKRLSAIARKLQDLLKIINDNRFTPDETVLQEYMDSAENLLDAQDEVLQNQ